MNFLVAVAVSHKVTYLAQNEGDMISFTCQATGGPFPTITWCFNGTLVSNETDVNKYEILLMEVNTTTINSTLSIMNVQSSDVGTYICNATNVVSSDTSSGVLTVNGKLQLYLLSIAMDYIFVDSCSKHYRTNGRTTV